jgi:phytoene dehydrogenase-like protein
MAVSSPFFQKLPLEKHGLKWIWPEAAVAHPLDDGTSPMLEREVGQTAAQFPSDARSYRELFDPLVNRYQTLFNEAFRPLGIPRHPFLMARFGWGAMQPATVLARHRFRTERARALFAGVAGHSELKLQSPLSAAFGLILSAAGHAKGWPIPRGGSQQISNALAGVLRSAGGRIRRNARVARLEELGEPEITMCDVSPRELVAIAGSALPRPFRESLLQYRYCFGAFKMDWALSEPIPWRAKECRRAATVHVGGTLEEIAASERAAWYEQPPENPFVILAQPTLFDPTRAPAGRHTAWGYCHVPNGWRGSAVDQIENQIERFAPGFRDCILARRSHTPAEMEAWDANLVGGAIGGGVVDPLQFVFRPTWRRYRTPLRGLYLCSASTPPGGSVHGMCGYWAARWALADRKKRR